MAGLLPAGAEAAGHFQGQPGDQRDGDGHAVDREDHLPPESEGAGGDHRDQRARERSDGLDELGQREVPGVFVFGRDVPHQGIPGDLERGAAGAQQQDGQQKDRERGQPHEGGDQHAPQHDCETQNQDELLALLVLIDSHGHRQDSEHDEAREGDQLGGEVREIKLLLGLADERAHGVQESHGEKGQKDGDGPLGAV